MVSCVKEIGLHAASEELDLKSYNGLANPDGSENSGEDDGLLFILGAAR